MFLVLDSNYIKTITFTLSRSRCRSKVTVHVLYICTCVSNRTLNGQYIDGQLSIHQIYVNVCVFRNREQPLRATF